MFSCSLLARPFLLTRFRLLAAVSLHPLMKAKDITGMATALADKHAGKSKPILGARAAVAAHAVTKTL